MSGKATRWNALREKMIHPFEKLIGSENDLYSYTHNNWLSDSLITFQMVFRLFNRCSANFKWVSIHKYKIQILVNYTHWQDPKIKRTVSHRLERARVSAAVAAAEPPLRARRVARRTRAAREHVCRRAQLESHEQERRELRGAHQRTPRAQFGHVTRYLREMKLNLFYWATSTKNY